MKRLLATLHDLVARQREAILRQDHLTVRGLSETLAKLLTNLSASPSYLHTVSAPGHDATAEIALLARGLQEQIRLNQVLLANGVAVADHFARCVAEASPEPDVALFSGIG
jgi:hypothetical protein